MQKFTFELGGVLVVSTIVTHPRKFTFSPLSQRLSVLKFVYFAPCDAIFVLRFSREEYKTCKQTIQKPGFFVPKKARFLF